TRRGGLGPAAHPVPHHAGPEHRRDPFEQAVGPSQKTAVSVGGALASPSTAYLYDWNMLPIGQQLWLDWVESLDTVPPLQAPASYNLSQVMDQVKSAGHGSD